MPQIKVVLSVALIIVAEGLTVVSVLMSGVTFGEVTIVLSIACSLAESIATPLPVLYHPNKLRTGAVGFLAVANP